MEKTDGVEAGPFFCTDEEWLEGVHEFSWPGMKVDIRRCGCGRARAHPGFCRSRRDGFGSSTPVERFFSDWRLIIDMRGSGATLGAIARCVGVSPQRIHQIMKNPAASVDRMVERERRRLQKEIAALQEERSVLERKRKILSGDRGEPLAE